MGEAGRRGEGGGLTVGQLISALQELPKDAPVRCRNVHDGFGVSNDLGAPALEPNGEVLILYDGPEIYD